MERFGEKLRALRTKQGLTLRELGAILEVSHGYVARLENGSKTPNIAMALKIANVFGVCMDTLVRDEVALDVGEDEEA